MKMNQILEVEELDQVVKDFEWRDKRINFLEKEKNNLRNNVHDFLHDHYSDFEEIAGKYNVSKRTEWQDKIETELEYLFRAMVGSKTKIVKIFRDYYDTEGKCYAHDDLYITWKHGLKQPRYQRSISILPYGSKNYIASFKDGKLIQKTGEEETACNIIDFADMEKMRGVSQVKLQKFFQFTPAILKIRDQWIKLLEPNKDLLSRIENMRDFSTYASLSELEAVPKFVKQHENFCQMFLAKEKRLEIRSAKILEKMKEANKPFRIILKLDESE